MNILTEKLKEVLTSVMPITVIVFLFGLTITPLSLPLMVRFLLGALLIVLGLAFFLIGVDIAIAPLGSLTAASLTKTNRLSVVITAGLILGFFISIAEPGLIVLANQVDAVTGGEIASLALLVVVSVGMAVMLAAGFVRIVVNLPLFKILAFLYGLIFLLAVFTSSEFLAISFDASGATTGVLAVPFILSLAVGVSHLKKDSKASEKDSFGLVAITSAGAILSVLLMGILSPAKSFTGSLPAGLTAATGILSPFGRVMPAVLKESFMAVLPLLAILLVLQKISFHLKARAFSRMVKGFIYAFLGLFIFLTGVNAGFMEVGSEVGRRLAEMNQPLLLVLVGFVLGVVTILAEPAVYVLTHQIEEVTSGYVKRNAVLIALSLGVGAAVALSMLRVVTPGIALWHYLLPGYLVAVGLMYVVPKLFVGIAFDAGGVATGPMTATFILAFTQGAADAVEGASVLLDGFGMIATVALTPIITLELLGLLFKIKSKKEGVTTNDAS